MVIVVKGGGRAPPTLTSQANFTLMMECTPESGRYHSVYSESVLSLVFLSTHSPVYPPPTVFLYCLLSTHSFSFSFLVSPVFLSPLVPHRSPLFLPSFLFDFPVSISFPIPPIFSSLFLTSLLPSLFSHLCFPPLHPIFSFNTFLLYILSCDFQSIFPPILLTLSSPFPPIFSFLSFTISLPTFSIFLVTTPSAFTLAQTFSYVSIPFNKAIPFFIHLPPTVLTQYPSVSLPEDLLLSRFVLVRQDSVQPPLSPLSTGLFLLFERSLQTAGRRQEGHRFLPSSQGLPHS